MKRVLVVKLSSLGDIAHALPAVRALKERVEDTEIDWVVQPEYVALLERCPDVSRAIAFPRRHFWAGAARFWRALRREEYDAVLDLQGLLKSALPAMAARRRGRAPKIGPAWSREGASAFYTIQPVRGAGPRRHAVEELLDVVGLYAPPPGGGGTERAPRPRIDIAPDALGTDDETTGPRIVFAPFSRWDTKNWPAERFAEAGRRLAGELGCRVFVLGGPGDREAGARLAQEIPGAREVCGRFDLVEMCAFLRTADLMVSVDSGPLHWADAMGVPAVAVYGSTDPARTGPYFQPEAVVAAEGLECRPCHSRQCASGDGACLSGISSDRVAEAVLARL